MTAETNTSNSIETVDDKSKIAEPEKGGKLRTIMEAASALSALGDEEDAVNGLSTPTNSQNTTPKKQEAKVDDATAKNNAAEEPPTKRYLPGHKKPDAAQTFPEKLMQLMKYAEKQRGNSSDDDKEGEFCVEWLKDGKSFVINNPDQFTRQVVPKFFKPTKFSSFTRKLYRWGFRQVNRGIGPDEPIIFGNDHFQRDDAELMVKMRSVTAAARKNELYHRSITSSNGGTMVMNGAMKRPLEQSTGGLPFSNHDSSNSPNKRFLFDQFMLQQKQRMTSQEPMASHQSNHHSHNNSPYGGTNHQDGNLSLKQALAQSPHSLQSMGLNLGRNHEYQGMAVRRHNNSNDQQQQSLGGTMSRMGSMHHQSFSPHSNNPKPSFDSMMKSFDIQQQKIAAGYGGRNSQQHNSLINQYVPLPINAFNSSQQLQRNGRSTADIVNAAINALRFAN